MDIESLKSCLSEALTIASDLAQHHRTGQYLEEQEIEPKFSELILLLARGYQCATKP